MLSIDQLPHISGELNLTKRALNHNAVFSRIEIYTSITALTAMLVVRGVRYSRIETNFSLKALRGEGD